MRIILAPAKKMITDLDSYAPRDLPRFLDSAQQLKNALQAMSPEELQALWKCNDKIAAQNVERLRTMDLRRMLTPAVLSYDGIAYRCMAPQVFTKGEEAYVAEHLRILSGFYGVLRPYDGVTPYRLEMQAKLSVNGKKDLYAFWGDRLAKSLMAETDVIVNLSSKEYADAMLPYLPGSVRVVNCVFGEIKNNRVVEKATLCKMARGEMVRFLAERKAKGPEAMRAFDRYDYRFDPDRSSEDEYVFIRKSGRVCAV